MEDVARHNTCEDAWIVYNSGVYNITNFFVYHPGGRSILIEHLGKDVSDILSSNIIHKHSKTAIVML
ncbi:cytochrome b5 domain-containing protein, partial [Salmonella sp. s51228]|uniref:cytochrome b5 domain-containing protein n=1 Tax=Salmonella sp. s51228 TaxID=3159652 RepID=UPI00398002C3